MGKPVTPSVPLSVPASALMHGSDVDFIVNAYLALQRHWPDAGGFAHYKYLLQQRPEARAQVLREIAGSATARHRGTVLVDDLDQPVPPAPPGPDLPTQLRISQVADDVARLDTTVGGLTPERITRAVELLLQQQVAQQAELGSRLSQLDRAMQALQAAPAVGGHAARDNEVHRLLTEQIRLTAEVDTLQQGLQALRDEVAAVRQSVQGVTAQLGAELRHQMAEYVTAFHAAMLQQAVPPAPVPRTGAPGALAGALAGAPVWPAAAGARGHHA